VVDPHETGKERMNAL